MKRTGNAWTHIIIEAYCARKWGDKKGRCLYKIVDAKHFKTKKVPNPDYDPEYKTPKKPNYCLGAPIYACIEKNCPHLAYTNALEEDYVFLNKRYKQEKMRENFHRKKKQENSVFVS